MDFVKWLLELLGRIILVFHPKKKMEAIIEIFSDAQEKTRWRIKAKNGKIIASSGQGFKNKEDAVDIVERISAGLKIVKRIIK